MTRILTYWRLLFTLNRKKQQALSKQRNPDRWHAIGAQQLAAIAQFQYAVKAVGPLSPINHYRTSIERVVSELRPTDEDGYQVVIGHELINLLK